MNKKLIALAITSAFTTSSAFAVEVDFGGDANFEGFTINGGEGSLVGDEFKAAGMSQRIRAKMHFKGDGGVSVNTRLILSDRIWTGDDTNLSGFGVGAASNTQSGSVYANNYHDTVKLDYGYVQLPVAGWTMRIGRQEANWGFGFNTADDRRDRILGMKKFGSTTILALMDQRAEGALATDDDTVADDDANLYALAAVGFNKGWLWGALIGQFMHDNEGRLDAITTGSLFAKGKIGSVALQGVYNYTGGGEQLWVDSHHAFYIDAKYQLSSNVKLEGLAAISLDDALVANGWDSYSMFIANSNDNSLSNTAQVNTLGSAFGYNLGGSGAEDTDNQEHYIAVRLAGSQGDFDWYVSGGALHLQDETGDIDVDSTVAEVGGQFNVTKTTNIYAKAGSMSGDQEASAITLGINTSF